MSIGKSAIIRTNKFFNLEKVEENIYLDHIQERTACIALSKPIKQDKYLEIIADIRNNTNYPMFDVARGAIVLDSRLIDIIRIYSCHLEIDLLNVFRISLNILFIQLYISLILYTILINLTYVC